MDSVVSGPVDRYVRALGPAGDDVIAEMDERADREGFPTVGPAVGGWLQQLVALVGARRVFEFGSGFGYSAYWIARGLPSGGEVVLTEVDADELADARENLERGGYEDLATFEHGDAIEIVDEYAGPIDVALIDNEKARYAEAFEAVADRVPSGGLVLADNAITAGIVDFEALLHYSEGETPEMDRHTRGIAAYLDRVRSHPDFETVVLPLGEGLAVSRRD